MAKKNALQEAIAEAKQLRQAAIVNATKQLEENLTPSIKAMLEKKLEEEFGSDAASILDEDVNSGFKKVKEPSQAKPEKKEVKEAEEPEKDDDEAPKDDDEKPADDPEAEKENDDEPKDDNPEDGGEDNPEGDEAPEESDDQPENPEDEEEELPDDTPLKDITLGDLKAIISKEIAAAATPAEPTDLESPEAGDVEGQGDETPAGDLAATSPDDVPASDPAAETPADQPDPELVDPENPEKKEDDDEEIDINEILKELEDETVNENKANNEMPENQNGKEHHKEPNENGPSQDSELNEGDACPKCGKTPCECGKEKKEAPKEDKNLQEQYETALRTIKVLKETLADVNVLNGKLVYANKTLKRAGLSEEQKNNILESLDKAKTIAEAKAAYRDGVTRFSGKESLVENRNRRQFASKAAGSSTKPSATIVEDAFVRRMQELAGIIE